LFCSNVLGANLWPGLLHRLQSMHNHQRFC